MADALDSKSGIRKGVRVRLPPPVPLTNQRLVTFVTGLFFAFLQFSMILTAPRRILLS